jgi:hypothetical protein
MTLLLDTHSVASGVTVEGRAEAHAKMAVLAVCRATPGLPPDDTFEVLDGEWRARRPRFGRQMPSGRAGLPARPPAGQRPGGDEGRHP